MRIVWLPLRNIKNETVKSKRWAQRGVTDVQYFHHHQWTQTSATFACWVAECKWLDRSQRSERVWLSKRRRQRTRAINEYFLVEDRLTIFARTRLSCCWYFLLVSEIEWCALEKCDNQCWNERRRQILPWNTHNSCQLVVRFRFLSDLGSSRDREARYELFCQSSCSSVQKIT